MSLEQDILDRYKAKTDPEHRLALDAIAFASQLMGNYRERYDGLLKAEQHMHNVGGLINPTMYRDMLYSKNFAAQTKLVKAALVFLDAVDAVKKELT